MGKMRIVFIIAALFTGLLAPAGGNSLQAAASTTTQSLNAEADLVWDSVFGVSNNDMQGRIYVGTGPAIEMYTGRGAVHFNLGADPLPGRPIKYELQLYVNYKEGTNLNSAYLDVFGSTNDSMTNADGSAFPSSTTTESVRKTNDEIPSSGNMTFDVTSIVESITSAEDRKATFVLKGNEAIIDARVLFASKEHASPSYQPKLIVTYSLNNSPAGSITINSGAAYTNSGNVTLNLSASDSDAGDVLQMKFSNDNTLWSSWESAASSKSWTLSGGDGLKTVYYQITDGTDIVTYSVSITLDTVKPIVSGVADNGFYYSNKTVTFNEGTATLNGSAFTSGTVVSAEGVYTLVVTDAAGNATTINFTIDKTKPAVTGVADGAIYNSDKTITFNEGTATLNGAPFTTGSIVSAEDDYTLVVTDAAGNVTTLVFTIDKTAPIVSGVTDGSSYNTDQTITFNEGTAALNGNPFLSGAIVSAEDDFTLVVTDLAGNVTTVSFTIDKTAPIITGLTAGTSSYTSPLTIGFNEGTATLNGQPFISGTRIASSGDYTLVVTDAVGNQSTAAFSLNIPAPPVQPPVQPGNGLEIEINGVKLNDLGKGTTTVINGNKVTTVTFDETKLLRYLDNMPKKPSIVIPVYNNSDRVLLLLNGQLIKVLNDKNAAIQIKTELASYTLAANRIDWSLIAKGFGSEDAQRNMSINIEITNVPASELTAAASKLGKASFVSPAIDFKITATHGSKIIEINKFIHYVERTIAIPESANLADKILMGVTIAKDGKVEPVPTRIVNENGKSFAVINSLTNSVYAVIAHEKTFADIQKHWAKNDIEQAAAKLIVQGVSDTSFQPNKQITRAEFTTMLIRALGLHVFEQPASYTDVKSGQWYYETVSIAESYGLVTASKGSLYNPNEKLYREEALVLLAKAMKLAGMETTIADSEVTKQLQLFKDVKSLDLSAREAAALNIKYGIIVGYQGQLKPDDVITRAETTVILQRFLEAAKLS